MPLNRINPIGGSDSSAPVPPPFPDDPAPWVRPADWLPLPTITPGDQIFTGLYAVFPYNPNYVALVANTVTGPIATWEPFDGHAGADYAEGDTGTVAGSGGEYVVTAVDGGAVVSVTITNPGHGYSIGASYNLIPGGLQQGIGDGAATLTVLTITVNYYTVDWGDGTVENVACGGTTEHSYDYATYDVAEATLSTRGYKQAVIKVTPQEGANLTLFWLQPHSSGNSLPAWLDLTINSSALEDVQIGGDDYPVANCPFLEQVRVGENILSENGGSYWTFYGLNNLQSAIIDSADTWVNCSALFQLCVNLRSVTLPDLPLCETLQAAFENCAALEKVVIGDLPRLQSSGGTSVFNNCSSLRQVKLGNLGTDGGGPINFSGMFTGCTALTHLTTGDIDLTNTEIAGWFTAANTPTYLSLGNMVGERVDGTYFGLPVIGFTNPSLIEYLKLGDMPNVTSLASMCDGLEGMRIFEMGDAPLCESLFHTWQNCYSLESWKVGDVSAALNAEGMLQTTFNLRSVTVSLPACADWNNAFNYSGIQNLTLGNLLGDGVFTQLLTQTKNLTKLTVGNIVGTTFPTALFASAPALQEIVIGDCLDVTDFTSVLTSLPAVTKVTMGDMSSGVTFTGMLSENRKLTSVTLGDTSAGTAFDAMFTSMGNGALKSVNAFNTSSGGTFANMFVGKGSLQELPAFDLSAATDLTYFAAGCATLSRSQAFGARFSHSYQDCNLGVDGLVEIFENLGTALNGQVTTTSISNGGTDYQNGDTVDIGSATFSVTADSGTVVALTPIAQGSGFIVDTYNANNSGAQIGVGTGLVISVDTVSAQQTITITGNPGTPYLTEGQILIAMDKGWTVVTS